jgi:hypothetical protein
MAKRTRGSVRPGQRRRTPRPAGGPTTDPVRQAPESDGIVARPSGSLTAGEEARAAEIEAQIRAEERAAEEASRRVRDRSRSPEAVGGRARDAAPLHVRASAEYAYVRRDIVDILRMGGLMITILVVLYALINVMGVIRV